MNEAIGIDHVLEGIAIVVSITALIIGATCALALKWISGMCKAVDKLTDRFEAFVENYYEKHAEVVKDKDCMAKHAVLDQKVDKLHERVDLIELDRR